MRYKGPGTNWTPIVLAIVAALVVLALLYYVFLAPKPATVGPTNSPAPTIVVPTVTPS